MKKTLLLFFICYAFLFSACAQEKTNAPKPEIKPAAESTELYFPLLNGKNIGLVVNQTSLIDSIHLVDTLLASGHSISVIFTLEHGFRGLADAGQKLDNSVDKMTGVPLISLYGSKKKPSSSDLENLDIILFDIQDVGVRFYTYISSLHYVMESCAESDIPLVLLDRPNPNIHFVDGPVLKQGYNSFVGMHSVPVVYGMTIGEYGQMINGESWLKGGKKCQLTVIPCMNYKRSADYILPVNPSPNLPNMNAIKHYPSLCFFEPTKLSVGRGTDFPFECFGFPGWKNIYKFRFRPVSKEGASKPKYAGTDCYGLDLRNTPPSRDSINFSWLFNAYKQMKADNVEFFTNQRFFDLLAGSNELRIALENDRTLKETRKSWANDLNDFKLLRKQYLIYPN